MFNLDGSEVCKLITLDLQQVPNTSMIYLKYRYELNVLIEKLTSQKTRDLGLTLHG